MQRLVKPVSQRTARQFKATSVTKCNVSDINLQWLRKVETFQVLLKHVSQRNPAQIHDIEGCYKLHVSLKLSHNGVGRQVSQITISCNTSLSSKEIYHISMLRILRNL